MKRPDVIARLSDKSETWDMLVVGGGATGLGCAVDAASRGYKVALDVDRGRHAAVAPLRKPSSVLTNAIAARTTCPFTVAPQKKSKVRR